MASLTRLGTRPLEPRSPERNSRAAVSLRLRHSRGNVRDSAIVPRSHNITQARLTALKRKGLRLGLHRADPGRTSAFSANAGPRRPRQQSRKCRGLPGRGALPQAAAGACALGVSVCADAPLSRAAWRRRLHLKCQQAVAPRSLSLAASLGVCAAAHSTPPSQHVICHDAW